MNLDLKLAESTPPAIAQIPAAVEAHLGAVA